MGSTLSKHIHHYINSACAHLGYRVVLLLFGGSVVWVGSGGEFASLSMFVLYSGLFIIEVILLFILENSRKICFNIFFDI